MKRITSLFESRPQAFQKFVSLLGRLDPVFLDVVTNDDTEALDTRLDRAKLLDLAARLREAPRESARVAFWFIDKGVAAVIVAWVIINDQRAQLALDFEDETPKYGGIRLEGNVDMLEAIADKLGSERIWHPTDAQFEEIGGRTTAFDAIKHSESLRN